MPLDLSRRRFIVGTFAALAGATVIKATEFIMPPVESLPWDGMLELLRKTLEPKHIIVKDESRMANFVSLAWLQPHIGPGPKMLVGWDSMEWRKITPQAQQESIEFIEDNMLELVRQRERHALMGREESMIRREDLGLWCHADS